MVNGHMEKAYCLFEEAEMIIDVEPDKSLTLLRQAVTQLLNAYLSINEIAGHGNLDELFQECLKTDSEFEAIQSEVEYLTTIGPEEIDAEEMVDTANEIWDFIQGMIVIDGFELGE